MKPGERKKKKRYIYSSLGADDYRKIDSKVTIRVGFFFLFAVKIADPLNNNMPFIFRTILKKKYFLDFIDLVLSSTESKNKFLLSLRTIEPDTFWFDKVSGSYQIMINQLLEARCQFVLFCFGSSL